MNESITILYKWVDELLFGTVSRWRLSALKSEGTTPRNWWLMAHEITQTSYAANVEGNSLGCRGCSTNRIWEVWNCNTTDVEYLPQQYVLQAVPQTLAWEEAGLCSSWPQYGIDKLKNDALRSIYARLGYIYWPSLQDGRGTCWPLKHPHLQSWYLRWLRVTPARWLFMVAVFRAEEALPVAAGLSPMHHRLLSQ